LGVLLVVSLLLGHAAQRLRLPAIVGWLVAGTLLGQTVLARLTPHFYSGLFPADPVLKNVRTDFLQVGLLIFVFLVGLEVDPEALRRRFRTIVPVSFFGLIVPFVVGFACVKLLPQLWPTSGIVHREALPLVVGVALSISALPVIAAILKDLGLVRSDVGVTILSAAVVNDVFGWVAFAAIAAAYAGMGGSLWQTIVVVFGAFAIALSVGRRAGTLIGNWVGQHRGSVPLMVGLALAATLLLSALMQAVGAHAFFGALIVGVMLSGVNKEHFEPIDRFVQSFFAPLYFGAIGLGLDFIHNFDLALVVVVFLIASLGKLLGGVLGARLGGSSPRDALAIASGLNARGSVEILLGSLALQVKLIDQRVFVAIVIMAVATSVMAGVTLPRILQIKRPGKLVKSATPVLQRLDGEGKPVEEIEIGPRLTIGRDFSNRLAFPDDELLSREHAVIRPVRDHFRIEDLGSTNGTLIWRVMHWQPVGLDNLEDGDIIVLGSNVFRFSEGTSSLA
jgi:Kef-type K+ transport system membrane component KefB